MLAIKRRLNTPSPDIGAVRAALRGAGGAARAQSGLNERRDNAHGVLSRLDCTPQLLGLAFSGRLTQRHGPW